MWVEWVKEWFFFLEILFFSLSSPCLAFRARLLITLRDYCSPWRCQTSYTVFYIVRNVVTHNGVVLLFLSLTV